MILLQNVSQSTRVKLADSIWDSLAKDENYTLYYSLLKEAIHPLFGEAIECFKSGHYHATAALCRSATECAVLASASVYNIQFSSMPNTNERYISSFDRAKNFANSAYPDYNKAFKIAKNRKIIDNNTETKINEVRKHGNFVMHYYNLLNRRLLAGAQVVMEGKTSNTNMIITENDAKIALEHTSSILKSIGNNLLNNIPFQENRPRLRFVLASVIVFAIVFLIILSTAYLGFNKTVIIESEVGLLTAYEFFMYNKFSSWFVDIIKSLVPKCIQNKSINLGLQLSAKKRASITNILGAMIFLVIFIFLLWLGSVSAGEGILALGFSINGAYITIENEVFGGIVGSWALALFFEVFGISQKPTA